MGAHGPVKHVVLPIALVMAAALFARAYDGKWIVAGDILSATKLKADLDDLDLRLKALESGGADCPAGYSRRNIPGHIYCARGSDEVVKVGTGASAFWVDRFEAAIFQGAGGAGKQYGTAADDYPASFPKNGARSGGFVELYAVSMTGVTPSGFMTWFQAQQACRASGKRLPSDEEWLAAASGTSDPGQSDGKNGLCRTKAVGSRKTGQGGSCMSAWGAEDMVGNQWEWTANWYAGIGTNTISNWPGADYQGDGVWNASGGTFDSRGWVTGIPSGAVRGGDWDTGSLGGVYAMGIDDTPGNWHGNLGFRCVMP